MHWEAVMALGFSCGELAKPVYFGLKALKRDILGGVTGREAVSVAIRAASHVYRQPGGVELLRSFHDELQKTAPSEMAPLFPVAGAPESEREIATPGAEARHEQVIQMVGR
jgi:hypothetical protein